MKNLICVCVVVLLGTIGSAYSQQRIDSIPHTVGISEKETRLPADAQTPLSTSVSFHHVWTTDVDYGYFESKETDLYYTIAGRGREMVVVVHGCPGIPKDYLHPMLAPLEKYVKLVYFDRRFDGLPRALPRSVMSIASMTADLEALRRSLGLERITLLAHGFGGSVALNYCLQHPSRVKRLILVGTSPVLEDAGEVEKRLIEALSPRDQEAYKAAQEGAFTALERDRRRYRVLYPRCFYRPPDSQLLDRDTYYIYFDALARKHVLSNEPSMFDFRSQLSRIRVPSLVIAGKHDLVTPVAQAEALAKGLPSSRLAVLHSSGHFPYFEQAALFTEWVRGFINDTADQSDDAIVTTVGER